MRYQQYRDRVTKEDADAVVSRIIEQLDGIVSSLKSLEGRHRRASDPCPICDVYKHHNHVKTQWRNVEDVHRDYDNNLLILGDDIDEKTVKEVFSELKNRFHLTVTPIRIGAQNKTGIPSVQREFAAKETAASPMERACAFVNELPVGGMVIDSTRRVVHANALGESLGFRVGAVCFQGVTAENGPCPWCRLDEQDADSACVISTVHGYNIDARGRAVLGSQQLKDVHWIRLERDVIIHFSAVRDLSRLLKERLLNFWRQLLPVEVSGAFLECIDFQ